MEWPTLWTMLMLVSLFVNDMCICYIRALYGSALCLLPPSSSRIRNNGNQRKYPSRLSLPDGIVRVSLFVAFVICIYFRSSIDPPEKDIPICTLKNFPYEIQHTIQWARELFEGLFSGPADTTNRFLENERGFLESLEQHNPAQRAQMLSQVKEMLIDFKPSKAADSVKWARHLFQVSLIHFFAYTKL